MNVEVERRQRLMEEVPNQGLDDLQSRFQGNHQSDRVCREDRGKHATFTRLQHHGEDGRVRHLLAQTSITTPVRTGSSLSIASSDLKHDRDVCRR
nr:hypothetical protein CFP56_57820 [Quercus suber]